MEFIKKIPNWAKALLLGGGLGFFLLLSMGAAYYFFYSRPLQIAAPPTKIPTMTVEPTRGIPTLTETLSPPTQAPTEALTSTPTEPPTPTDEPQYCDAFTGIEMTVVYLDWFKGEPLEFYIKMPGGVPGLEKEIPGAVGEWTYSVKIGDYSSENCEYLAGYRERLYCSMSLPEEYEKAARPMALFVNKCDENVFSNQNAFLPEIKK